MQKLIKSIFGWLAGPATRIAETYMKQRADVEMRRIEQQEARDLIRGSLRDHMLTNEGRKQELVKAIMRRDRGDWRTSWIRPVTAAMALVFWAALTLSQIELGGNGILPIIWNVPPGFLGQVFLAFPAGVLATFTVVRPIEKIWSKA